MKRKAAVAALLLAIIALLAREVATRSRRDRAVASTRAPSSSLPALAPRGSAFDFAAITLKAARGVRLEGLVLDEDEQPVAGALVVEEPDDVSVVSGGDGSFTFEALSADVEHAFYATHGELTAGPVDLLLLGPTEPLILHARRGTTVIVHVRDDRGPLAGARVDYAGVRHATDATGTARVPGVAAGFQALDVTAPAHVAGEVRLTVAYDPGSSLEATVTLARGSPLDGVVLGPDGRPVPAATVDVDLVSATTDPAGHWQIDGMPAGTYELSAYTATYGTSEPLALELDGATPKRDIVVHLAADRAADGIVVDRAGAPIPNAVVEAWDADSLRAFRTTTSDARGAFTLRALGGDTWRVYAHRGSLATPIVEVAYPAPATVRLVAAYAAIRGTVVDAHGGPIAEARVVSMADVDSGLATRDTVTDSSGRFDLSGMPVGAYQIGARRQGVPPGGETWLDARTGDDHLVIALPELGTVRGRVVVHGTPLATFLIQDSENDPTIVRGAADGRFELRELAAGDHTLGVIGDHTSRVTVTAHVEPGKVTDLGDIALEPAIRITGHVWTITGAPVAGAVVQNVFSSGATWQTHGAGLMERLIGANGATTDASGAYVLEDAGEQHLWLRAEEPTIGASRFVAMPEADAVIDFVLLPLGGIDGTTRGDHTLVRADGVDPSLGHRYGSVERDGTFHIDRVMPGDYQIGFEHDPPVATVTVAPGQRATITLP